MPRRSHRVLPGSFVSRSDPSSQLLPSLRRVCVFCGSNFGTEPAYRAAAVELGEDSIASMNLWAFPHSLFARLVDDFEGFVLAAGGDEASEFLLPTVVSGMMSEGALSVDVVPTSEAWVGVTHPADLDIARTRIADARG